MPGQQPTSCPGPYQPEWSSLERRPLPDWYEDAKFGIFIHWGAYAVPAFDSEWYPRNMYQQDQEAFKHHVATYGPQTRFGYKDFFPMFTASRFDPDWWAALFHDAGARFVVPVAEHHDGFPMYRTALSRWNAAEMGPKRDIIAELADAVRRHGMVFGASSHRAEHWWFFDGGRTFESDVQHPANEGLYGPARPQKETPDAAFLENWLERCCEIVDRFRPQLVWFDWWIEEACFEPYLKRFAAYLYNRAAEWGVQADINYKNKAFPEGAGTLDIERGQLAGIRPLLWQNDTSVSNKSWGYIEGDEFKSATHIIGDLVDIVSKNGCLLLNIGPRADGTIPQPVEDRLREVGAWLKVNGEAIYGTRPWTRYGEGPTEVEEGSFADTKRQPYTGQDIRFTRRGDTLYAIALAWPGRELRIASLPSSISRGSVKEARLLGHPGALSWTETPYGLTLDLPDTPAGKHAYAFKIDGLGLG